MTSIELRKGFLPAFAAFRRLPTPDRPPLQPRPQYLETHTDIAAPVAYSEPVLRNRRQLRPIDARRQQQDASLLHQALRKHLDAFGALVAGKSDAPAVGHGPLEKVRIVTEELLELRQVARHEGAIALEDPLARPEGDARQHLRRSRIADGEIVLEALAALQKVPVCAAEPADPQPGEPIGFRHDVE